jgi:hypothetical protein
LRHVAVALPGLLLVATIVDDPLFGGLIVAAELAYGTGGLLAASFGFVVVSTAMAASTAWALRTEPVRLSERTRRRITALRARRLGRFLLPHPERPTTTAIAAVIFGSVAPMIVGALETDEQRSTSTSMVLVSGLAYGIAFATGYGLLGALVGTAA